ncbi:MAG: phosphate ABC transporter permease subunit PstC, partial [Pseudomonadota bacterium]|nr:phosphate ABC transporter permease subunit PstC [Pseudomonadota bacterium]
PDEVKAGENYKEVIVLAQIYNVVNGINFGEQPEWVNAAAAAWHGWEATSTSLKTVTVLALSLIGGMIAYRMVNPDFRSRNAVERIVMTILAASSAIAILTTIGIVFSVIFESMRFFTLVPVSEFLFGTTWNPQFEGAERAGSGQMGLATYGSVPLFAGTFLISVVALSVSVPVGLFSAIYLSEYATPRVRSVVKPLMELLAGVPTVVYGFFAALTVAPFIRASGMSLGLDVASESALAAGLVMGIMIIPFVSSLSDDVINAVPQALRDAAYGLGSTRSETVRQVVLPAALPGIVAAVLLAVSRAVGETMIVVMAAGLAANLSLNPLDAVTTVTSQIVTILVGDQEFESAKTLSAFALALTLIVITLGLNFIALQIVKKYREQYE